MKMSPGSMPGSPSYSCLIQRTVELSDSAWIVMYMPIAKQSPSASISPTFMSYASFATGDPDTSRIVVAASSLIADSRELRISKVIGSSPIAVSGICLQFAQRLVDGQDVGKLLRQDVQRGLVLFVAQRRRGVTQDGHVEVDHHRVARG